MAKAPGECTVTKIGTFQGHEDVITAMDITPDGCRLVTCSEDRTLKVWDIATGRILHDIPTGECVASTLLAMHDPNRVLLGRVFLMTEEPDPDEDCINKEYYPMPQLQMIDLNAIHHIKTSLFRGRGRDAMEVALAQKDAFIAAGFDDGSVCVLDSASCAIMSEIGHQGSTITSILVTPDSKFIISGSTDGEIIFWDQIEKIRLKKFNHRSDILHLFFPCDGHTFFSSGEDSKVIQWDIETGKRLREFNNKTYGIKKIYISHRDDYLFSCPYPDPIQVWRVSSAEFVNEIETITCGAFSCVPKTNGIKLYSGTSTGEIEIFDINYNRKKK